MANANPAPNVSAAFIIDIDKIQSSERSRALIAKIDFIPLETNDNSIVEEIDKVVSYEDDA